MIKKMYEATLYIYSMTYYLLERICHWDLDDDMYDSDWMEFDAWLETR